MTAKIILANDLMSGDVIFLARDTQNWTRDVEKAWIGESDQLIEQILNVAAESHLIIGAEAVEIDFEQGQFKLKDFREHLRSQGPSVRTDLGKQAIQRAA